MKALLYSTTLAILIATPVLGADSASLVGTWTASEIESPRTRDGAVA